MRLLVLVCGGRAALTLEDDNPSPTEEHPATEKRRRRASLGSQPWRPSLGVISEDGRSTTPSSHTQRAPAPAKSGGRNITVRPESKNRGSSNGNSNSNNNTTTRQISPRRDNYGHMGIPVFVPAYAPTTFFF